MLEGMAGVFVVAEEWPQEGDPFQGRQTQPSKRCSAEAESYTPVEAARSATLVAEDDVVLETVHLLAQDRSLLVAQDALHTNMNSNGSRSAGRHCTRTQHNVGFARCALTVRLPRH